MKINKYNINRLLKLILIFSIIFSPANSVLAETTILSQSSDTNQETKKDTDNLETEKNKQTPNNDRVKDTNKKINNQTNKNNPESVETTQKSDKKENFNIWTIKNILLLLVIIDLPILVTLFSLWFLDRKKQQNRFEELRKNQNKIKAELNRLNEINDSLNKLNTKQSEISQKIKYGNSDRQNIHKERRIGKKQTNQFSNNNIPYNDNGLYSNKKSNTITSDRDAIEESSNYSDTSNNKESFTPHYNIPDFVDTYNRNKNSLSNKRIDTVSQTQESMEQIRSGNSDRVILEKTRKKKYWIIEEANTYYLIPHAKINIDDFNITTLEYLFDCTNFTPEYSDFKLVVPAKVSQSSELWQLDKKGKIEFS